MVAPKCSRTRIRVLVPYMFAYAAGVRRLLGDGLPYLSRNPELHIDYAELCANQDDMNRMESDGVAVLRSIGIPGSGTLAAHTNKLGKLISLISAIPRFTRLIFRLRSAMLHYNVVYVHGLREFILAECARALLPISKKPSMVWHCHGVLSKRKSLKIKSLGNRCTSVIAVSDDVVSRLRDIGISSHKIRMVFNAVDQEKILNQLTLKQPLPMKNERQVTLLFPSATLRAMKGAHIAITVLSYLPKEYALWLTGDIQDTGCQSVYR